MGIISWLKRKKPAAEYSSMLKAQTLRAVFEWYYLNDEKVNTRFVQAYGDLAQFTQSNGTEVASSLGTKVDTDGALALLAGLRAGAEAKRTDKRMARVEGTYELSALARFLILYQRWSQAGALVPLDQLNPKDALEKHALVSYTGPFWFTNEGHHGRQDHHSILSEEQAALIRERQELEQEAEKEKHHLFLIKPGILAVSILSKRFIGHTGIRYLVSDSGEQSGTLFVGTAMDRRMEIQFLNPIAIGYFSGGEGTAEQ